MMDIAQIRACLQARRIPDERGDHDLNPDLRPDKPLRPAAILVALVERKAGIGVLLTRRAEHLEHHPGQISFPGGHIERTDRDATAAALRETHEEIGIAPERIEVLGRLNDYVTRTGFHVTPVVGAVRPPLNIRPDSREVDEVFEVPLAFFLDPANHHKHERLYEGVPRSFYAMPYGDYYIWGATAGMLMDLYRTLKTRPQDAPIDALCTT
ncbi:MAG: CoA pyrophosphatase [Rhodospirillales bacterium]|nr:CoA pyrophosphatase [Rhodospirillales bacterium]